MAVLDSSDFSSSDGWTVLTTNGPTVFNQSDGGRTYARTTKNSGSWHVTGFYRGPITGVAGHTIYCDYRVNTTQIVGTMYNLFRQTAGLNYIGNTSLYAYPSNVLEVWTGNAQVGSYTPALKEAWLNNKAVINSDGTITFSVAVDDGTPNYQVTSWTEVESSTIVGSGSFIDNVYFATNCYHAYSYDWANYYYTDDGTVPVVSTGDTGKDLLALGEL